MDADAVALQEWLRRQAGFEEASVLGMERVEGGASNVTLRAMLADAPLPAVALRVQRARGIFQPYDVLREAQVLRHLAGSEIPVPRVIGVEASSDAFGQPFAVLEWINAPHMGEAGPDASFAAYSSMVARIHALDWRRQGLEFLGVPIDAAAATNAGLDLVEQRMQRFPGADADILQRGAKVLRQHVPAHGTLALCQGDINVFNYLFRRGEVVGVVDWEAAHIGDPRSDVGQLVALAHLRGLPLGPVRDAPFIQAYEMRTLNALDGMEYFRARWLWELGVIYFGWIAFNDTEPWYSWDGIAVLLEDALDEVETIA